MKNFFSIIQFSGMVRQYIILVVHAVLTNVLDLIFLVSIFNVIQYLDASTNPMTSNIVNNTFLSVFYGGNSLDILDLVSFSLVLCIISYIAKLSLLIFENIFTQKVRRNLINKSLEASLYMDFVDMLSVDFETVANTVTMRSNLLTAQLVRSVVKFQTGMVTFTLMACLIAYTAPLFVLVLTALVVGLILLLYLNSGTVRKLGGEVDKTNFELLTEINLSFSLLRTIRINNIETIAAARVKAIAYRAYISLAKLQILKESPRLLIEFIVLAGALTAFLFYFGILERQFDNSNIAKVVLILLGVQRMFPAFSLANQAFNGIVSSRVPFREYIDFVRKTSSAKVLNYNGTKTYKRLSNISVRNLTFSHSLKNDFELKVKEFVFKRGNITIIDGPSGSGKSTLILLILGLLNPQKGEIIYRTGSGEVLDKIEPDTIEYVSNDEPVFGKNLLEYITSYRSIIADMNMCEDLFNKFGLSQYWSERESKTPLSLSLGERQRIKIIRALVNKNASLIILDESISNLDKKNKVAVVDLIAELIHDKIILVVSHDASFEDKQHLRLDLGDY